MDENKGEEKLELTDFFDPLVMWTLGIAVVGDVLFIVFPLKYIMAIIVGFMLYGRTRGFITKLIFIIGLINPLPLLTVSTVVAILLSNAVIRFIVVQIGIVALAAATGGVGLAAEGAVVGAEAGAAGAEVAAGTAAAGAAAGATGTATTEVSSAAARVVGEGASTAARGAEVAPGPFARPPEMAGPQAQMEEQIKKPSLKERLKKKGVEKLGEKLEEDKEEARREIEEGGGRVVDLRDQSIPKEIIDNNDDDSDEDLENAA